MRRRMMMNKGLVEVEYLESTEAQWIDTGIIASLDTKVEIGVSCLFRNTRLLSTRTEDWTNQFEIIPYSNGVGFLFRISGNGKIKQRSYGSTVNWKIYDIVMSLNETTVDGNNATGTYSITDLNNPYPIILFAGGGDIYGKTPTQARVYYLRIYNGNDLVLDFVPVRKRRKGYMYDKVSGELFGNAGTGKFILGPDVK